MRLILLIFIALFHVAAADSSSETIKTQKEQLEYLNRTYKEFQSELRNIEHTLDQSPNDLERRKLIEQKNKLEQTMSSLVLSLEEVATGGLKLNGYDKKEVEKAFDWQSEMLEVFKPMIAELKELTANARKIESLREKRRDINSRLQSAKSAIRSIDQFNSNAKDSLLIRTLTTFKKDWSAHELELSSQRQIIDFKLNKLLNPPESREKTLLEKIRIFIIGRGLTLVLALGSFLLCFTFFMILSRKLKTRKSKHQEKKRFLQRALKVAIQLGSFLVSIAVTMFVLYLRGDWVLLGFIMVFLAAACWGLSQSLPKQIQTIKILMNVGTVREGERVFYQGIPWIVESLNVFAVFKNPRLKGGSIKLPINMILDLVSRQYDPTEEWFPTEDGDYVFLSDGTYGQVISQSPESVIIRTQCSHKTYATSSFVSLNPRNISRGFAIYETLGISYKCQSEATSPIPKVTENYIKQKIESESWNKSITSVDCSFDSIGDSSLNLKIIVICSGDLADRYFNLKRHVQSLLVEICTEQCWTIPFQTTTLDIPPEIRLS